MTQIEIRGRFVEQEQPRTMLSLTTIKLNEHARKVSPMLFATRERGDDAILECDEADLGESGFDKCLGRSASGFARAHAHNLRDREWKRDRDALRQYRSMLGEGMGRIGAQFASFEMHGAGAGPQLARQNTQQRGFSGSVRADNGNGLASLNGKIDLVEQRCTSGNHIDRACFDQSRHSPTKAR